MELGPIRGGSGGLRCGVCGIWDLTNLGAEILHFRICRIWGLGFRKIPYYELKVCIFLCL